MISVKYIHIFRIPLDRIKELMSSQQRLIILTKEMLIVLILLHEKSSENSNHWDDFDCLCLFLMTILFWCRLFFLNKVSKWSTCFKIWAAPSKSNLYLRFHGFAILQMMYSYSMKTFFPLQRCEWCHYCSTSMDWYETILCTNFHFHTFVSSITFQVHLFAFQGGSITLGTNFLNRCFFELCFLNYFCQYTPSTLD